jgi:hypothetical protein
MAMLSDSFPDLHHKVRPRGENRYHENANVYIR